MNADVIIMSITKGVNNMAVRSTLYKIADLVKRRLLPPHIYARSVGVKMGHSCKISTTNFGTEPYLIELGNNVHITSGVTFINHEGGLWVFRHRTPNFDVFGKIKVGSNTYIGNNATLLYGIEIGNNCIIGYGSVVTKSVPPNSVAVGCPAKVITSVSDFKEKVLKYDMGTKLMRASEKRAKLINSPDTAFIHK